MCALIGFCVLILQVRPGVAQAQEAADYFRQNCTSCHTIGGGMLTGPDLKNVTEQKARSWLVQFMTNPKAMIDSGDPYALKLQQAARGVVMPLVPGMTRARAGALLDLIEAESKLEKSQFAGIQISDRPFTAADVARGRMAFTGTQALEAGGAPCLSCHTVKDIGGLGGGRLGPNLTRVYERLHGRKNLATWLTAPATPTMQAVFRDHPLRQEEILSLVAFFEDSVKKVPESDSAALLDFFLFGMGGAAAALVLFDLIWRRRFRGVRRPLVQGEETGGAQ